jgi:hypothetical protein
MFHFGSVMKRFRLLWSFWFINSSFMLFTSCSFLLAVIMPISALQKFSYCGLVRCFLNFEEICLSLLGISAINPNMNLSRERFANKL